MRRLVLALAGPVEERGFRIGWSLWRRSHQATAKRCHVAKRRWRSAEESPVRPAPATTAVTEAAAPPAELRAPIGAPLTDEEWERARSVLPPQKPCVGRPRRDQRAVLDGILWVLGTGSSWREVPRERFGPWETVYGRYRELLKEGRWQRVLEALRADEASMVEAEVAL